MRRFLPPQKCELHILLYHTIWAIKPWCINYDIQQKTHMHTFFSFLNILSNGLITCSIKKKIIIQLLSNMVYTISCQALKGKDFMLCLTLILLDIRAANRPVLLSHLQVQPQAEMRHFFSVAEYKLNKLQNDQIMFVFFKWKNKINASLPFWEGPWLLVWGRVGGSVCI